MTQDGQGGLAPGGLYVFAAAAPQYCARAEPQAKVTCEGQVSGLVQQSTVPSVMGCHNHVSSPALLVLTQRVLL